MFVPPRRSDDHAPFDLWIGDGDFRSMTKEEIAWVRTTTGCNGILQGSPFITLEGASIRHYRTIGGQPVCYDNDCSPVRRGAIGNTRCNDPLPELRDVDFFSEARIAKIVSALPAKPKLVVEFWKTILVEFEVSRTVDSRTLPAYIAGRPAVYFGETNPMFPNLQPLTARGDIPDTMVYSPIRAGIRLSCADKSLSTTLGAFVAHPDGRRRFMVASHGFPQGGAAMHQYDERRVGNLNEGFPGSDISLAEVQEGVSFDTSDYFDVAPPRRMAPLQDLKCGNYAATDSWRTGRLEFLITGKYSLLGSEDDHWELRSGILGHDTKELPGGICGSPVIQEDYYGVPSWQPSLIGQYRFFGEGGHSFVTALDSFITEGWKVDEEQ